MPTLTKVAFCGCGNKSFLFNQHSYSNTKVFVYDVCLLRIDESLFEDQNYVSLSRDQDDLVRSDLA